MDRTKCTQGVVVPFDTLKIVSVVCGEHCTFYLSDDGSVFSCGNAWDGQLSHHCHRPPTPVNSDGWLSCPFLIPDLPPVNQLSCRYDHCLAVAPDRRTLYGWGWNRRLQLAVPNLDIENEGRRIFRPVVIPLPVSALLEETTILDIGTGEHYSVILTSQGRVYLSGACLNGQMDVDEEGFENAPIVCLRSHFEELRFGEDLDSDSDSFICQMSCGVLHAFFLSRSGKLWCWGSNDRGQLGFENLDLIVDDHPCAWNWNLGLLSARGSSRAILRVDTGFRATYVTIERKEDEFDSAGVREVYAFGNHDRGQCGCGEAVESVVRPCLVELPTDYESIRVSPQPHHVFFHCRNGDTPEAIYVCGWNKNGQALPMLEDEVIPVPKPFDVGVFVSRSLHLQQLLSTKSHTVVFLHSKGEPFWEAWVWGYNDYGCFGVHVGVNSEDESGIRTPIQVKEFRRWK